jgi:hypothetical protein
MTDAGCFVALPPSAKAVAGDNNTAKPRTTKVLFKLKLDLCFIILSFS